MKSIKHIMALCLSLVMLFSIVVASGVTTASALAGAGIQKTSFRSYGIDISYWNAAVGSGLDFSRVNFAELKADGCQFVILRIGYEASASRQDTIDDTFIEYYKRARAAGMPMGVYFYALTTTKAGAAADAKWVIDVIEKNNMYFEYPIYYDLETSEHVALGSSAMEQLCLGWCETLEAAGYFPGIYGGGSQVIDKLSSSFKSKYDLWYPRYKSNYEGNQHAANAYDFSDYCGMWQHAIFGYYDGLATSSVDMNVCYKDYPAIMKQYGYNNCVPDKPEFEGNNVALNKNYEATTYGSYTANLTDGKAAKNMSYDGNWFSFYHNPSATVTNAPNKVGTVVINLNGRYDINGIIVNSVQNETSGVGRAASVKAYLSKDGTNWGSATALTVPGSAAKDVAFYIKGAVDGTASYVKLEFALSSTYLFINEIEVYGTVATGGDDSDNNQGGSSDNNSGGSNDDIPETDSLVFGKQYTSLTAPNRDNFLDDGQILTDGRKGQTNVNQTGVYSGWKAPDGTKNFSIELLFDLGSAKKSDTYTAYMVGGNWGIALPKDSISIDVYASDNESIGFDLVASASLGSAVRTNGTGVYDQTWSTYTITAVADKAVTARYVKLVINYNEVADRESHIWLDEVEIFNYKTGDDNSNDNNNDNDNNDNIGRVLIGDVDFDGDVDAADYVLVKRAVLKNYTLNDEQIDVADIDADGDIDAADYVLVKRIVLGTYNA